MQQACNFFSQENSDIFHAIGSGRHDLPIWLPVRAVLFHVRQLWSLLQLQPGFSARALLWRIRHMELREAGQQRQR